LEDYDENDKSDDQANDIETLSDHLKINEVTQKLSDDSKQHISPYTSKEEDDESTEEDNEFEESEILEDISDGIIIISCNFNINY
jgi:hypothetical protein